MRTAPHALAALALATLARSSGEMPEGCGEFESDAMEGRMRARLGTAEPSDEFRTCEYFINPAELLDVIKFNTSSYVLDGDDRLDIYSSERVYRMGGRYIRRFTGSHSRGTAAHHQRLRHTRSPRALRFERDSESHAAVGIGHCVPPLRRALQRLAPGHAVHMRQDECAPINTGTHAPWRTLAPSTRVRERRDARRRQPELLRQALAPLALPVARRRRFNRLSLLRGHALAPPPPPPNNARARRRAPNDAGDTFRAHATARGGAARRGPSGRGARNSNGRDARAHADAAVERLCIGEVYRRR